MNKKKRNATTAKAVQAAPVAKPVEPRISLDEKTGTLIADCDTKADSLEVIRSAAYVLTDRAFALLEDGPAGTVRVLLQLKQGPDAAALKALAQVFQDELATQRLRHQIAKNNVSIREYIVEQAVLLAQQPPEAAPPQAPPEPELTEEQRAEIERLIAEVEAEIRAMAPQRAASDPLKISATWEERHAPKKPEAAAPGPEPKTGGGA